MRISLIVDNPLRDLEGLILLAIKLANYGHEVYLTPMSVQVYDNFRIAPDFALVNYIRGNNIKILRNYIAAGISVGVLDTEGAIFFDINKSLILPLKKNICDISLYFTWGDFQKNAIVVNKIFSEDIVFATGSPRYDLYSKRFFSYTQISSEYLKDNHFIGTILFNTNYPIIFSKYQSLESEISTILEVTNYDEFETRSNIRASYYSWVETIKAIEYLSLRFPNIRIIVRPHPFERLELYDSLTKDLSNVFVMSDNSVLGYLAECSVLIHRDCTTAIEAYFLGKPSISIEWLKNNAKRQSIPLKVSQHAFSLDELGSKIEQIFKKELGIISFSDIDLELFSLFGKIDGFSCDRISNVISSQIKVKNNLYKIQFNYFLVFFKSTISKLRFITYQVIVFLIHRYVEKKILHKSKKLNIEHIVKIVSQILNSIELDSKKNGNINVSKVKYTSSIKIFKINS